MRPYGFTTSFSQGRCAHTPPRWSGTRGTRGPPGVSFLHGRTNSFSRIYLTRVASMRGHFLSSRHLQGRRSSSHILFSRHLPNHVSTEGSHSEQFCSTTLITTSPLWTRPRATGPLAASKSGIDSHSFLECRLFRSPTTHAPHTRTHAHTCS